MIPATTPSPHLTLKPQQGWAIVDLRELWRARDLIWMLAARDIKVRYKQTLLGVVWVVLQPLLSAGIFTFVFATVAKFDAPGAAPYFLFSFVGLMGFDLFAKNLQNAGGAMVGNAGLLTKVYFPRLALPVASLLASAIDWGIVLIMFVVMALIWRIHALPDSSLPLSLLLLVPCALILWALALGLGLLAGGVAVKYRDVGFILPVAARLAMYASPVAYGVEQVPEPYRFYYYLNPLAAPLEAFKVALLGQGDVNWAFLGYSAGVGAVVLVVGTAVFARMERRFADVV